MLAALATIMGVAMASAHFFQAYKMWRAKSSANVSLFAFFIFSFGSATWLAYGVSKMDQVIIWPYLMGTIGATLVVILIFIYRRK